MVRCLVVSLLVLLACSSICVESTDSITDLGKLYGWDTSKCAKNFTYNGKFYKNCTTDGDNGDVPWCSTFPDYNGVFNYCYDFTNTSLKCQSSYTINGKTYTGCNLLSKTSSYKQCKTSHPYYVYKYCTDAIDNPGPRKGLTLLQNCSSNYTSLSNTHTACILPSDYAFTIEISDDEKQALLDIHNSYRADVSSAYMFELHWDDKLAVLAQNRSNLCGFDHDLAVNRLIPEYGWKNGQNIVMSTETRISLDSLIDSMLDAERDRFRYGVGCNPPDTCLHYTQAMISNMTRVGCGHTQCVYPHGIERFLTCNYIQSQYASTYMTPYVKSKVPASACPAKNDSGLCDCGNVICRYDLYEYLEPNTCKCIRTYSKRSLEKRDIEERSIESGRSFMVSPSKRQLNTPDVEDETPIINSPTGVLEEYKRKKRSTSPKGKKPKHNYKKM